MGGAFRRSLIRCLALGAIAAGCSAPRAEDSGTARAPIIGGTIDPGDPAVVQVRVANEAGLAAAGTGTLVSPHVVMTAAHVVSVFGTDPTASYRVFIGDDRSTGGSNQDNWLTVREIHVDPALDPRRSANGHDAAVLILDAASTIPPIPLNREPVNSSWIGRPIRAVGYGSTASDDLTGISAGARREVTTTITSFGPYFLGSLSTGNQPCHGDSGGPGFVTVDGVEKVVGIVSTGDSACTSTAYSRVDVSVGFVDSWIAQFDPVPDAGADGSAEEDAGIGGPDAGEQDADLADVEDTSDATVGPERSDPGGSHSSCAVSRVPRRDAAPTFVSAVLLLACALRRRRARR